MCNNNGGSFNVKYEKFPFVQTMIDGETSRNNSLLSESKNIRLSKKSNLSYMETILLINERALDKFIFPWILLSLNAVLYTVVIQLIPHDINIDLPSTSLVYTTQSSCLAFLLVFRLNRAAVRWWDTRRMWGDIIRDSRVLASAILENIPPSLTSETNNVTRAQAMAWLCGFVISCKDFLRGNKVIQNQQLSGIMNDEDIARLEHELKYGNHPALFAASELRHVLKNATRVNDDTNPSKAISNMAEMKHYENYIHSLITNIGGMERVKSTPLPIVYVTHLRTFLFIYLLCMPYVYATIWGWYTIPSVSIVAFLLLGIDGAATECEIPFSNRSNHLDMNSYCRLAIKNIQQLVIHSTDMYLVDYGVLKSNQRIQSPKTIDEFIHKQSKNVNV